MWLMLLGLARLAWAVGGLWAVVVWWFTWDDLASIIEHVPRSLNVAFRMRVPIYTCGTKGVVSSIRSEGVVGV